MYTTVQRLVFPSHIKHKLARLIINFGCVCHSTSAAIVAEVRCTVNPLLAGCVVNMFYRRRCRAEQYHKLTEQLSSGGVLTGNPTRGRAGCPW